METLWILIGIGVVVFTFFDFFTTTLSGNGFGALSGLLNRLLNRLIIRNRNHMLFRASGPIHLLFTTSLWLVLLFGGTLIIFTASEEMVINMSSKLPASFSDRFYFTAYLLSTLGIGNFIPGNNTAEVLAGIFSFTGFILITTGLTYLLSVVQSVMKKKELAFYICTLGDDVEQLYQYFKKENNLSSLVSDTSNLRQQILSNSSSYLAFPTVNYFVTVEREKALIVQLAILYEVMLVLKKEWHNDESRMMRVNTVIRAIRKYLNMGLEKPSSSDHDPEGLQKLRSLWNKHGYSSIGDADMDVHFSSSLKYAGWKWEHVYQQR